MKMNVLELYSGIGGMHLALKESGVPGRVICAIDINNVANSIYKHNFPDTLSANKNISGLTPKFINNLGVDTILMSPPCQPFTRNGLKADMNDSRTDSFCHILNILPQLNIKKILLENVKGFERSDMRNWFIENLEKLGFVYQEFLLSPTQLGIPNTRCRYYCLAKRHPETFVFEKESLMKVFPSGTEAVFCNELKTILETEIGEDRYSLPDKVLKKRAQVLDICYPTSRRSCCFTKGYGRYVEGTGSVFTDKTEDEVKKVYESLENLDVESEDYMILIRTLNLRFFTPREIGRLMGFPETFNFTHSVTDRQCYMVLGNSINIKVVSELIKFLK